MVTDRCLICGEVIPEGRHVCALCEKNILKTSVDNQSTFEDSIIRGDVFYADLNPVVGSETGGIRPIVIIQNNAGNKYSTTVIAAIASSARKRPYPVHIVLGKNAVGLKEDTTVLLEQIRTLDKRRLRKYLGRLDSKTMKRIDAAAACSIGLSDYIEMK